MATAILIELAGDGVYCTDGGCLPEVRVDRYTLGELFQVTISNNESYSNYK